MKLYMDNITHYIYLNPICREIINYNEERFNYNESLRMIKQNKFIEKDRTIYYEYNKNNQDKFMYDEELKRNYTVKLSNKYVNAIITALKDKIDNDIIRIIIQKSIYNIIFGQIEETEDIKIERYHWPLKHTIMRPLKTIIIQYDAELMENG